MYNIHCAQYIVHIHCINTWLRYTITLAASKSWPPWFGSAFKMQDIQYGNTARYIIWQYMARYGKIWQCNMAKQQRWYQGWKLLMKSPNWPTELWRSWNLGPTSGWGFFYKIVDFFLTNNQFYFSSIFAWTIKWQKYSMWSTWTCWWWRSQI